MIAFSFNNSIRKINWRGFTPKYYEKAFSNEALHDAFINSIIVASISTLVSTVLGAMLGILLYRFRFPLKGAYEGMVHLPVVIQELCMGVALLAFFAAIKMPLGLTTITVSHIAFTIHFVAVVIRARMAWFDLSLEEVACDPGAGIDNLSPQNLFNGAVQRHVGGERRLDSADCFDLEVNSGGHVGALPRRWWRGACGWRR